MLKVLEIVSKVGRQGEHICGLGQGILNLQHHVHRYLARTHFG